MRRSSLLTLCLTMILGTLTAQKNTMTSLWRDSAIVIDGSPTDWEPVFRYYDSKSKLQYSVVNDSQYVYVCLKTTDEQAQMKIMRAGMSVWFDTTGKKKEVSGVHFPLKGEAKLEMHEEGDQETHRIRRERPDVKKMKRDFGMMMKEMRPEGLRGMPNDFTPIVIKNGLELAINWDKNDIFTYELKMPLALFYKEQLTPKDTLKPISLIVKVNAMEIPQLGSGSAMTDPGVTGAGGMGGGVGQNGMNGRQLHSGQNGPPPGFGVNNEMGQVDLLITKVYWAFK